MPLIMIHGLGQAPSSWDKTIAELTGREDVLCPDLSELLQGEPVNYPGLYRAFSEYCGALSGPLHLCGLSLGGVLALHYGIEHPEAAASLVLIGAQYRMPIGLLTFQNAVFHVLPKSAFQNMGFGKKDMISLSNSMKILDFSSDLQRIACPVLVICGEKDSANRKAAEKLTENLPNAQLQWIAGAGHEVNLDQPERLAELLNRFCF